VFKIKWIGAMVLVFLMVFAGVAMAANTTTQDATITVEAINEISTSAGTVDITINAANASVTAGDSSFTVTDTNTTMSYTTNEASKKITAAIDADYAAGITLQVNVASTSATSAGDVTLSTTAADVITGLGNAADSAETITYTATSTTSVAPNGGETHTVTFTLTDTI